MTCPKCQQTMTERSYADVTVQGCPGCGGVFLDRADLGALVEAENDWHAHQSANTAALPRITDSMTAPPVTPTRSRAFVEVLFKA